MTTAPTPHLLPCPFCGGPVRVLFRRVSNRRSGHFAECRSCEVRQGQPQPNRDAAVENWNHRAELEARKPLPLSDEQLRAEFIPWAEIQYRHEDEFTVRDFKICLAAWSAGRRITGGSS